VPGAQERSAVDRDSHVGGDGHAEADARGDAVHRREHGLG